MNKPLLFFAALLISLAALVGCGPDPNIGKVTGTITYKGQPVEGAKVTFRPTTPDGVLAVDTTDAAGRYELTAPVASKRKAIEHGAFAGKYHVTVRKLKVTKNKNLELFQEGKITYEELQARGGGAGSTSKELLPARYASAAKSGLEADVKAKTDNVFNFDLVD